MRVHQLSSDKQQQLSSSSWVSSTLRRSDDRAQRRALGSVWWRWPLYLFTCASHLHSRSHSHSYYPTFTFKSSSTSTFTFTVIFTYTFTSSIGWSASVWCISAAAADQHQLSAAAPCSWSIISCCSFSGCCTTEHTFIVNYPSVGCHSCQARAAPSSSSHFVLSHRSFRSRFIWTSCPGSGLLRLVRFYVPCLQFAIHAKDCVNRTPMVSAWLCYMQLAVRCHKLRSPFRVCWPSSSFRTQRICTSYHAVCSKLSPLQLTRFGARLIHLRAIAAACNPFQRLCWANSNSLRKVALNVANARICTQNSLIVFNRTAPFACRLCSAFPNRETWRTGSSMRLDALAEVAFRQVQVSFQILRRSQFRHVPGSKHSKRFFSKSFDSSRNFETTWPYSTRSCSVSWSSTLL